MTQAYNMDTQILQVAKDMHTQILGKHTQK